MRNWSFDLRYLLDQPPWDTEITPPEVVELVEGEGLLPGRALDLGCGTGTNCIYLARHGWEVVGATEVPLWLLQQRGRQVKSALIVRTGGDDDDGVLHLHLSPVMFSTLQPSSTYVSSPAGKRRLSTGNPTNAANPIQPMMRCRPDES